MKPVKVNFLLSTVLLIPIVWISWSAFEKTFHKKLPGEYAYHAANKYFSDGLYEDALNSYKQAVFENPNLIHAKRGIARSLMQLGDNDEALDIFNKVIELEPSFATSYANRGILHDRMQAHTEAIADYQKALQLDPNLAKGPSLMTRFLRNQSEEPATIVDRLHYLQTELNKPKQSQVLHIQEKDEAQLSYKR